MAQRGTGTYLLVREGVAPRATAAPAAGNSLLPDELPATPAGIRVRRRAVATQPGAMDPRLHVWLDPGHEATDRLYRAANPLLEALGPVVLISGADASVAVDQVATNLAGACCAYHQTALIDLGDGPGLALARLGLPVEDGLGAAIAARRLDPTAPIEVLGPARGLDVLGSAGSLPSALRPNGEDGQGLQGVVRDLAGRAGLVLVIGPALAEVGAASSAWQGLADGLLVVGPPEAGQSEEFQRLAQGRWPVGWLAVDCPTPATGAA